MNQDENGKILGWKIVVPGLLLLLLALAGLFIIGPFRTPAKAPVAVSSSSVTATATAGSDQTPASEEGRQALAAAKAGLQQRHPGSRFESFKVDYCTGNYAVVTFLIDGQGSAAYLKKQDNAWTIVVEGANPPEAELRAKGFPANIAQYPPPCPVNPRGD